ncbi:hypothetical protein [Kitasatospora sp. KL5]|uniref:hypothetical protein n=1 Tax=Kitasatospora sp. KL5 TaxID=3425125 RepID=UPI003D6FA40A
MSTPTTPPSRPPFTVPVDTNTLRQLELRLKGEISKNWGGVEALNAKVNPLVVEVGKHGARLDRYDELRIPERIIEMSRIMDGLVRRARAEVPVWNWNAMTAEEAGDAWALLLTWIREVFYVRWPADYRRAVTACWFRHPDVVELMSCLYLSWRWAYEDEDGTPIRMAEWLDRWRPSLVARMVGETSSMAQCSYGSHRNPWDNISHPDDGELSAFLNEEFQRLQQRDAHRAAQQPQQGG